MADSPDNFPEDLVLHCFSAHQINILTAAIIVDMIEAMWVCESAFEHIKGPTFVVHEVNELLCVEFNAFVVLSEVDTSNL